METTSHNPIPRRLLGVWAHPDDEAYLSAGLMDRVIEAGGRVSVLTLSDGELGFAADDSRSSADRAALRQGELRAAMAEIGVNDVRFVGHPDGGLDRLEPLELARTIGNVVRDVRPDTIVTFGPDGMTGHSDHIACGLATTLAWSWSDHVELLYATKRIEWMARWRELHDELGVWMDDGTSVATADHEITMTVGLSATELDRKRAVLARHASQTEGLVAALGEATYREWVDEEIFRRPRVGEVRAAVSAAVDGGSWVEAELVAS